MPFTFFPETWSGAESFWLAGTRGAADGPRPPLATPQGEPRAVALTTPTDDIDAVGPRWSPGLSDVTSEPAEGEVQWLHR